MKINYFKLTLTILVVAFVVPQIAFASWWNPFSWGWVNRIFHFQQTEQKQEKLGCNDLYWYDNSSNQPCQEKKEFCGAYMYYGLHTFKTLDECQKDWNSTTGKNQATSDEAAGWKTHTNANLGFEFKYPSDWLIKNNSTGGVSILSPENERKNKKNEGFIAPVIDFRVIYIDINNFKFDVKKYTGKDFVSIKEYLKSYYGNVAEIDFAGKKAYAGIFSTSVYEYSIYVQSKNGVYILSTPEIGLSGKLDPKNPTLNSEAKTILSTFRFIK